MSNVASLEDKKSQRFLASGVYSYNRKDTFEEKFLSLGAVVLVIVPLILSLAYSGIISFIAVLGSMLVGVVIGLIKFYYFPYKPVSYFNWETVPENTAREVVDVRKAA